MALTKTIHVSHLGGIDVGYRVSGESIDTSKPTVVLINSMCTTVSLYDVQFNDENLTNAVNLLAIEPLGHGATATTSKLEQFTYWDSAIMSLQVMDALNVSNAFALGTSQGGWVIVRMALLAPERIRGLLPLGTSMDYESATSRASGSWDPNMHLAPLYESLSSTMPTPDFVVNEVFRGTIIEFGFSGKLPRDVAAAWDETMQSVYSGDPGRKKLRMALTNLMTRDGLLLRVRDIECPVYWLHGVEDAIFPLSLPQDHIKRFTGALEATLEVIEGGGHYLNATSPTEVNAAVLRMVAKYT